jgi:hypothetical protein
MKIFGKDIKKKELLKKIGDISQLGGAKIYEFVDGVGRGTRAIDIKTICGMDFTVLADRALDISSLSYKSIPISWRSATKETSPMYYDNKGTEWLRTFYGGLLLTCGLSHMGAPCTDDEDLGLHGRISNISAEKVNICEKWVEDDYIIQVEGTVREVKVFGSKIELRRKITTWMDYPKILVEDTIENIGFENSPVMVLYHVNIGYPVLDNGSRLLEPKAKVLYELDFKKKIPENFLEFGEPIVGFEEECYYHNIEPDEDGNANIAVVNEKFNSNQGLGIWLKYNKNNLPYLVHWKQQGAGEYVCGISPGNSLSRGRKVERNENTLVIFKPGEKKYYRLEFNILASNKEIEFFKKSIVNNKKDKN